MDNGLLISLAISVVVGAVVARLFVPPIMIYLHNRKTKRNIRRGH